MEYDFSTIQDRRSFESIKWKMMEDKNPKVPKNVIPLSVADMEFPLAPEIKNALLDYINNTPLGYLDFTPSYLQAVCEWMNKRHNWNIDPEWIIPMPGVVPSFFTCIKALSSPGDGVIVFSPVYYPFYRAIEKNNRKVVSVELIEKDRKYTINFDEFSKEASKNENKILLFCSPHNPVGRVWTEEELSRVAEICKKNNIIVVSDEIHFDLIMPNYKHHIFAKYDENAIILTAPSKTFNIAGLQCSNMIIKNKEYRDKINYEIATLSIENCNALGYIACKAAYLHGEAWLNELLQIIDLNKKTVESFFEKRIPQIKVSELEGTYLQWWDFRELGFSDEKLEDMLVNEAYIFSDMGTMFKNGGSGFIRINLACPTRKIKETLERLEKTLKKYV